MNNNNKKSLLSLDAHDLKVLVIAAENNIGSKGVIFTITLYITYGQTNSSYVKIKKKKKQKQHVCSYSSS